MNALFLPVLLLAITMAGTPGPNNMMLTVSGARFGYRKTLPHIVGIELGMIIMLVLSGLGIGLVFSRFPWLYRVLKIAGCCYIAFLAFRIAFSVKQGTSKEAGKPLTVIEAVLFQFLNPKAYMITVTTMSAYPLPGELYFASAALIVAVFAAVIPVMISIWAVFGTVIGRFMYGGLASRGFHLILGGLTLSSVLFLL